MLDNIIIIAESSVDGGGGWLTVEEGFAIEQQYINEGTSSSSQDGAGDGARVSSEFIICYV